MLHSPDRDYGSAPATREGMIRGGAITTAAQVTKAVLMLGSQVAIARLLVPEDFGLIAMVAPILGLIQVVADLGVPQVIVQSQKLSHGDINRLFWRNILVSLVLAAVAMAASPAVASLYGDWRLAPLMLAMAALVPISAMAAPLNALLTRDMRYGTIAKVEIAALAINAGVTVAAALGGLGYWSLFLGMCASQVSLVAMLLASGRWRPSRPQRGVDVGELVRSGNNATAANIAGFLNFTIDSVMIGVVLGEFALGLYDRAFKFAVVPQMMILVPISRVAVPTLSRLVDDPERYRRVALKFLQVLLLICIPLLSFGAALSDPLIDFLLGARWDVMSPVFAWLCVGVAAAPFNFVTFWLFISQNRTSEQMRWAIITTLINIAAYAGGLYWGLVGVVALAAASNWLLQVPLLLWAVSRRGPVDWRQMTVAGAPLVLAGACEAVALIHISRIVSFSGFWGLTLATFVAYAVFLAAACVFPPGRAALSTLWTAAAGRLKVHRPA